MLARVVVLLCAHKQTFGSPPVARVVARPAQRPDVIFENIERACAMRRQTPDGLPRPVQRLTGHPLPEADTVEAWATVWSRASAGVRGVRLAA